MSYWVLLAAVVSVWALLSLIGTEHAARLAELPAPPRPPQAGADTDPN